MTTSPTATALNPWMSRRNAGAGGVGVAGSGRVRTEFDTGGSFDK
jgi:hypothetical protein